MPENPWYPFYTGDYLQKTAHLSLSEHGAYLLLLNHFYGTGQPLPSEKNILFRICRANNLQEKRDILSIISQFFYEKNGKFSHKKAEEILTKRLEYSKSQSANAHAKHHAKIMPARASTTITIKEDIFQDALFEKFFYDFPKQRKGGREKAKAAWEKAIKRSTPSEILSGLELYLKSDDVVRGYAKGAAPWLNDDAWGNTYSLPLPKETHQPKKGVITL